MKPQTDRRYLVEQHLLPSRLYESGPFLLNQLLKGVGSAMEQLYFEVGARSPEQTEFTELYRVFCKGDTSVFVYRIGMPAPKGALLSRAAYLCYCSKNGDDLYFTSELAENGQYLLCCRPNSEQIKHILCCEAPDDVNKEFEMVADYYRELVIDDGIKQFESLCAG